MRWPIPFVEKTNLGLTMAHMVFSKALERFSPKTGRVTSSAFPNGVFKTRTWSQCEWKHWQIRNTSHWRLGDACCVQDVPGFPQPFGSRAAQPPWRVPAPFLAWPWCCTPPRSCLAPQRMKLPPSPLSSIHLHPITSHFFPCFPMFPRRWENCPLKPSWNL